MEYLIVSLRAKLNEIKGDKLRLEKLQEALSFFSCKRNKDEEDFIRNESIFFEISNKARTYLLISDNKIVSYFSIAFKSIDLIKVSKNAKKRITAGEQNAISYASYLIGHLAKDDSVSEKMIDVLLDSALSLIFEAQNIIGGRLVYLDCKNEAKLVDMYKTYGFKQFNVSPKTGLLQLYLTI